MKVHICIGSIKELSTHAICAFELLKINIANIKVISFFIGFN